MLKNTKQEKSKIEQEIQRVHELLSVMDVATNEYEATVKQLEVLYDIEGKTKRSISPDTAVLAATNILGIILVIRSEEFNVVTSKAFGMIMRGRV